MVALPQASSEMVAVAVYTPNKIVHEQDSRTSTGQKEFLEAHLTWAQDACVYFSRERLHLQSSARQITACATAVTPEAISTQPHQVWQLPAYSVRGMGGLELCRYEIACLRTHSLYFYLIALTHLEEGMIIARSSVPS